MGKLSLVLIFVSYACVSSPTPPPEKPLVSTSKGALPLDTKDSKQASRNKKSTSSSNMDKVLQGLNDNIYTYLVQFAESVSKTSNLQTIEFTVFQDEVLAAISGTESQTEMQKAILTLSILAHTSHSIALAKSPEEGKAAVYNDQTSQNEPRVLESMSSDYEINLGEELTTNPFLKSTDIHHFAILTIAESDATQEFKNQQMKKLQQAKNASDRNQQKIESWLKTGALMATANQKEEDISAVTVTPNEPPKDQVQTGTTEDASAQGTDTNTVPAALEAPSVSKARELSLVGNFKESAAMLARVPANSPEYPEAQAQLKTTSNTAAQELRRKAAAAYQNSLLVSDVETRKSYLSEAKKYLETALADFPAADLKSTVKDNLEKISNQLNELQKPRK
ncbi:MAG: hypothetical protein WCI18_07060 [Pseudomonadota bacterium]